MSFGMCLRAATRLSAIHKHFSTFTSRRCHPYDLVYPNHRFDRLRLSTIYTTSMQFRKKPLEEQNLVNPLLDRRKRMNDIKLEKNKKVLGTVDVYHNITVGELAKLFGRTMEDMQLVLSKVAQMRGVRSTDTLNDMGIIHKAGKMCGYKMKIISNPNTTVQKSVADHDVYPRPDAPLENLEHRPPVITIMGHVDHGKTTLLDTLRGASVAAGEAGGITQHIGAFSVDLDGGETVTFLDTPGHAAFSAMRARGAHCTDIVVLVIAAEDGVMPQTIEVLDLVREGNIPMVVAINKIDAPGADVEAAKNGLLKMGVNLEGFGGDVQWVCISALLGKNLDKLVEAITTEAVLMDLKSEYTGRAEGVVIESKTDPRRGKLSTMIVTRGTLRKGCILVAGTAHAKVRAIFDHNGQPIDEVTPGMPAEILGWRELPSSGEIILEVENEKRAHSVIHFRNKKQLEQKAVDELDVIEAKRTEHEKVHRTRKLLSKKEKQEMDWQQMQRVDDDATPTLNIVVKADVHGSVEAILDVLDTYDNNDICRMNIVHYGVGPVIEGDVEMAKAFNAIIYCFSMKLPPNKATSGVEMREFNVIYRLIENIQAEIDRRLPEVDVEDVIGEATVQQIFHINERNKKVPVLGCRCTSGTLKKNLPFKVIRDNQTIYDGKLNSMRHLKSEVDSIKKNTECGLQLADKTFEPMSDDKIVCYTMKKDKLKVAWNPAGFGSR